MKVADINSMQRDDERPSFSREFAALSDFFKTLLIAHLII